MIDLENQEPLTKDEKIKGKHITCKTCNHKFKLNEEERLNWKKDKFKCPVCGILYCNMPQTERELQTLQDELLRTRNPETLGKIYLILKNYISSIILKNYSNFIKDKEELEYYSHISASVLIINYDNPNFLIEYSFAGYIIWKIRETMFSKDEVECGDTNIEYAYSHVQDCSILKDTKTQIDKEDSLKYLYQYLIDLLCSKSNKDLSLKLMLCFYNFILYGEKGSDRIFKNFNLEGKGIFYGIKDNFKNKLINLIKN